MPGCVLHPAPSFFSAACLSRCCELALLSRHRASHRHHFALRQRRCRRAGGRVVSHLVVRRRQRLLRHRHGAARRNGRHCHRSDCGARHSGAAAAVIRQGAGHQCRRRAGPAAGDCRRGARAGRRASGDRRRELLLLVELDSPAGDATDLAALPGQPYVRMAATAPFSTTERVHGEGPLWIEDLRREDGRWIVPGAVEIFTARGKKVIDVGVGDKMLLGLLTPLPGSPSTREMEWSPWYPQAPEGQPPLPDQFTLRYRVVRASDPVRTRESRTRSRSTQGHRVLPRDRGRGLCGADDIYRASSRSASRGTRRARRRRRRRRPRAGPGGASGGSRGFRRLPAGGGA